MKLTPEMLTGKSREHLINLPTPHSPNHFLQAEAMKAFQGLQQSAVKNHVNFDRTFLLVSLCNLNLIFGKQNRSLK